MDVACAAASHEVRFVGVAGQAEVVIRARDDPELKRVRAELLGQPQPLPETIAHRVDHVDGEVLVHFRRAQVVVGNDLEPTKLVARGLPRQALRAALVLIDLHQGLHGVLLSGVLRGHRRHVLFFPLPHPVVEHPPGAQVRVVRDRQHIAPVVGVEAVLSQTCPKVLGVCSIKEIDGHVGHRRISKDHVAVHVVYFAHLHDPVAWRCRPLVGNESAETALLALVVVCLRLVLELLPKLDAVGIAVVAGITARAWRIVEVVLVG